MPRMRHSTCVARFSAFRHRRSGTLQYASIFRLALSRSALLSAILRREKKISKTNAKNLQRQGHNGSILYHNNLLDSAQHLRLLKFLSINTNILPENIILEPKTKLKE